MNKLWVVCIDDQRDVLNNIVQDLLSLSAWIDIDECESAEEAMELIDEQDARGNMPALVISDHIMPGKNGVEFLTMLQQDSRFSRMKKILLTGQATHQDTIDAINQAKVDLYIEKPWTSESLVAGCRRLLTDYLFESGLYEKAFREFVDGERMIHYAHGSE